MWIMASVVVFLTCMFAFGALGTGLALALDDLTDGAVTASMAPKTWCAVTLVAIIALALSVPTIAPAWWPSLAQAQFFTWWSLTCFCAGIGLSMAFKRSIRLSQIPDTVDQPRLSVDRPAAMRLHIYGQESWHGEGYMVGSRDALEAVGRAVSRAVSEPIGVGATPVLFPSDDEGFRVMVIRAENDAFFRQLPLPYFGDTAGGTTPEGKVKMLVTAELQEAILAAIQEADETA